MEKVKQADRIRGYVRTNHIEPSRRSGQLTIELVAGEIRKEMGLRNDQIPAICGALKARKFREENGLVLERLDGPPKKMASTVRFIFRLQADPLSRPGTDGDDPLLKLYGLGKGVFGEEFIRKEREQFYGPGKEL